MVPAALVLLIGGVKPLLARSSDGPVFRSAVPGLVRLAGGPRATGTQEEDYPATAGAGAGAHPRSTITTTPWWQLYIDDGAATTTHTTETTSTAATDILTSTFTAAYWWHRPIATSTATTNITKTTGTTTTTTTTNASVKSSATPWQQLVTAATSTATNNATNTTSTSTSSTTTTSTTATGSNATAITTTGTAVASAATAADADATSIPPTKNSGNSITNLTATPTASSATDYTATTTTNADDTTGYTSTNTNNTTNTTNTTSSTNNATSTTSISNNATSTTNTTNTTRTNNTTSSTNKASNTSSTTNNTTNTTNTTSSTNKASNTSSTTNNATSTTNTTSTTNNATSTTNNTNTTISTYNATAGDGDDSAVQRLDNPATHAEHACAGQALPRGLQSALGGAAKEEWYKELLDDLQRFAEDRNMSRSEALSSELRACLSAPLDEFRDTTAVPERVFYRGSEGFEAAKQLHNMRVSWRVSPDAVVYAGSTEEVAHAVRCAMSSRLPVYGRSGANAFESYCERGCVLVDVSRLKRAEVDAAARTAVLGAGLNLGQAYYHLYERGFTIPGGTCHTVGLAGLTLGGGKGRLARLHGMLIDHLIAVEMVLPNGQYLQANTTHHADLLWLARGGGGNVFPAVAVAFHFKLVDAPNITWFEMQWNISQAERVVEFWQTNLVRHSDRRLHVRLELNTFGSRAVRLEGTVAGGELGATKALMRQIGGALGEPHQQNLEERTWLVEVMKGTGIENVSSPPSEENVRQLIKAERPFYGWNADYETSYKYRALIFSGLNASGIRTLVNWSSTVPNNGDGFYLQVDPSNGAVGEIAPSATAYPWRGAHEMTLQVSFRWPGTIERMTPGHHSIADHSFYMIKALQPHAQNRSYYNYLDKSMPGGAVQFDAYWGPNKWRVATISMFYANLGFNKEWELKPAMRYEKPEEDDFVID